MKSMKYLVTVIVAVFTCAFTTAQTHNHSQMSSVKTGTFKVSGNCDMCKARIEKAAKTNGADEAVWNIDSKILTVTYKPSEVSSDEILRKVAAAGHDNVKFRTSENTYNSLPGCCKYEREFTKEN